MISSPACPSKCHSLMSSGNSPPPSSWHLQATCSYLSTYSFSLSCFPLYLIVSLNVRNSAYPFVFTYALSSTFKISLSPLFFFKSSLLILSLSRNYFLSGIALFQAKDIFHLHSPVFIFLLFSEYWTSLSISLFLLSTLHHPSSSVD